MFKHLWVAALIFCSSASAASTANEVTKDPVFNEQGYYVASYGDGAYFITDGLYNSMFVVSDDGVIVVDAPPTYARHIPAAIKAVTDQPLKFFVYSHHHKDHTGGAAVFGNDITYVSHQLTANELQRKQDPQRPIPTLTFNDKHRLALGNQVIDLSHQGLGHSPGNIFIHLPKQQVLMVADVLYAGAVPFERWAAAASVSGFYKAYDIAESFDFKYFQGGHVGRPGTRADMQQTKNYINDVRASAGLALSKTPPPVAFDGSNFTSKEPYFAINSYIDTTTEVCNRLILDKWTGQMKSLDIYAKDHCRTAIIDILID